MNKGFSLVELIVVIAIMAILVGVAVPVYTSYIEKANVATDIQAIDNLEHACKIVAMEYSVGVTFAMNDTDKTITATIIDDGNDTDAIADAANQLAKILGDSVARGTGANTHVFTLSLDTTPIANAATNPENKAMTPKNIAG